MSLLTGGLPKRKSRKIGLVGLKQSLVHWHFDALRVTDPRSGGLGNRPMSRKWLEEYLAMGGWDHISNLPGAECNRESFKSEN